jgi:hypothetical protein
MHLREKKLKRIPRPEALGADPEPPGGRFEVLCQPNRPEESRNVKHDRGRTRADAAHT